MAKAIKGKTSLRERKNVPISTITALLTESGYRCAVPRCRNILALDMHHIHEFAAGGTDELSNLVALCPYCHSLHHRGTISAESIRVWKALLVAISRAFDLDAIDKLLFLEPLEIDFLVVDGNGVLGFARLIAAGLAEVKMLANNNGLIVTYVINITQKGKHLVIAWREGDRMGVKQLVGGPVPVVSLHDDVG